MMESGKGARSGVESFSVLLKILESLSQLVEFGASPSALVKLVGTISKLAQNDAEIDKTSTSCKKQLTQITFTSENLPHRPFLACSHRARTWFCMRFDLCH